MLPASDAIGSGCRRTRVEPDRASPARGSERGGASPGGGACRRSVGARLPSRPPSAITAHASVPDGGSPEAGDASCPAGGTRDAWTTRSTSRLRPARPRSASSGAAFRPPSIPVRSQTPLLTSSSNTDCNWIGVDTRCNCGNGTASLSRAARRDTFVVDNRFSRQPQVAGAEAKDLR